MMLLTLHELLSVIRAYLAGTLDFSVVRSFVFQFYEAEREMELDDPLGEVFPILLSYLHYEESEGDPDRDKRLRRLVDLLQDQQSFIKERVVFALEFDDIRDLAKKFIAGDIPESVYEEQVAKLSPCEYDCQLIQQWGVRHVNEDDPIAEELE